LEVQAEMAGWLRHFRWKDAASKLDAASRKLIVADVGCRSFVHGAPIEALFTELGIQTTLHGIEVDAWRRFTDLRTRHDYATFHASRLRDGHFHALDFLDFREPLDVALLTEPFVTEGPLLAWGLPLSKFEPRRIFAHAHALLAPQRGLLLVSCPDEDELNVARSHWEAVGFEVIHSSVQTTPRPRHGALLAVR